MTLDRLVVAAVAALALVALADAVRGGGDDAAPPRPTEPYRIELSSSRERPPVDANLIAQRFRGAISKVAVRGDVAAVALSHVPGDEPSRAAIEVWRRGRHVRTFRVPLGSFSLGLWFTAGGDIATIGWDERARLWTPSGRRVAAEPYFAYETG